MEEAASDKACSTREAAIDSARIDPAEKEEEKNMNIHQFCAAG